MIGWEVFYYVGNRHARTSSYLRLEVAHVMDAWVSLGKGDLWWQGSTNSPSFFLTYMYRLVCSRRQSWTVADIMPLVSAQVCLV
jgi:hypothetical protein